MAKSPNKKASFEGGSRRYCNCFTKLKNKPDKSIQDNVSSVCEDVGGHCSSWKRAKNGNWYITVGFDGVNGDDDLETLAKSIQEELKRAGIEANVCSIFLVRNQASPNGKQVNEATFVGSPHSPVHSPRHQTPGLISTVNNTILRSMRDYGQVRKHKNWKEFAVILVLPESEYKGINHGDEVPESLLNKYTKTAVPSSYVSSVDHCEDTPKSVVHAEVKLVGDPKRHPSHLAVPYDRSCLVQLITENRKSEWESGKSVDEITKSFKVFLYSEATICDFCIDAILDSFFCNLVEKNFCSTDEYQPVIGYCFNNEDIITTWKKRRVQFFGPDISKPYSIPAAAMRNLENDLANMST